MAALPARRRAPAADTPAPTLPLGDLAAAPRRPGPPPRRAPAAPRAAAPVELRAEVATPWPVALHGSSMDGLFRRRGAALQRLVHVADAPVLVGVVALDDRRLRFGARGPSEAACAVAIERLRFAVGADDDHRELHELHRGDRYIGRALRAFPGLRVRRRPDPWEALYAAITEQLIEFERAVAIQRRITARHGRRCAVTGMRDAPTAAGLAALAPAQLAAFDLPQHRATTLWRAAGEVARGRIDLTGDPERSWQRLRAIPGIGAWTTEMVGLHGQGRMDQLPAADVGYLKLVGRIVTGNPRGRADEEEVRGFFLRYDARWRGLAGEYLRVAAMRGWIA